MLLRSLRKPMFIGGCIGAACVLLGAYTFNSARYIYHVSKPSEVAQPRPLQPASVDSSWIKFGDPNFRVTVYAQTNNTLSGIWACDGPTTFEWTFPHDEQVYIIEGSVDVEYLGNRFTLRPGESAIFLAGTKAVWHVPEMLKKSFTLHRPSAMVRLYRRIFGVI